MSTRPSTAPRRVVVWGTGNVGQPAIRAVVANEALELAAVVVADPGKVGVDAGRLADIGDTGVAATADPGPVLAAHPDAVAYTASADFRPDDALDDVERCLRAGVNVVTPGLYPLFHPPSAPPDLRDRLDAACLAGEASLFASGIDPGWAFDLLPLVLSGVGGAIEEIRAQELFDYSLYDAPDAVRELVGMGMAMDEVPPMLLPSVPTMVWGPMLRVLADGLGVEVDEISEHVERRPLDATVEVAGMGEFAAGTQGAFRFELRGRIGERVPLVVEHITRITPDVAADWPSPPDGEQGCHRVIITGRPSTTVTVTARDGGDNPAEGGNASAAGRLVNAIPAVCELAPGLVHPLDLPLITGRGLLVP